MKRRTFLKGIFPALFMPKLIIPTWRAIRPISYFETIRLPIINRVFPTLLASELVSIQPMTGPAGTIFYMDFVTTSNSNDDEGRLDFKKPTIHQNSNLIVEDNDANNAAIEDWLSWRE